MSPLCKEQHSGWIYPPFSKKNTARESSGCYELKFYKYIIAHLKVKVKDIRDKSDIIFRNFSGHGTKALSRYPPTFPFSPPPLTSEAGRYTDTG